jgi:hypothetical protein
MTEAVYCVSSDEPKANAILTQLRSAGFNSEISVLLESDAETKNLSLKENAARGAGVGSVVGALLALTIPGIGPALAIGPIAAMLGGAAAGGVVGGLAGGSGAVAPLGIPDEVADEMKKRLSAGDILIGVHTSDKTRLEQARQIFKTQGAEFIHQSQEKEA